MPADRGRYPSPAVALPSPPASLSSSRVAAPPGAPFAGDHATASPLTQCPPARLWLNARRPTAVLKPAGLPLTQARRIAADSSTGSALIHARWPPLSLAPWIKSTCHGQECRVSVLLCPQEHFKLPCLVHGDSSGAGGSSCCGHGGHSSRLPPCCWSGGGRWGTLWGPLTPDHAQRKPQPPS